MRTINSKDELINAIKLKEDIHSSTFTKFNVSTYELYIDIYGIQYCKNCNIELNARCFNSLKKGFKDCCSLNCTNMYKYGVSCVLNTKSAKEKVKNTLLNKYGVENPSQIDSVKEKKKLTCLDKYNVENPSQIDSVKEKKKLTCLDKYGVEFYSQTIEYNEKVKNTSLLKYNAEHYTKSEEYKENIKNKKHISQYHITNFKDYNQEFIENNFIIHTNTKNKFDMYNAMKYYNVGSTILHRKFDIPKSQTLAESEIRELIQASTLNDREFISPLELDVLSHKYKFAVEYNGLMWHSSGKELYNFPVYFDKNKHLLKTNLVQQKEYELFHVFENEWLNINKKEIWKSIFYSKMNKNIKINISLCIIKEINKNEANEFLDLNHLDGKCTSHINIGLLYKDELYSLICLSKIKQTNRYVIDRFCIKNNFEIENSLNDLLNYFYMKYKCKSITVKSNKRWCNDVQYLNSGFVFSKFIEPVGFYFKPGELILKEEHDEDESKMFNYGYRKIYDCGYNVLIKEIIKRKENDYK